MAKPKAADGVSRDPFLDAEGFCRAIGCGPNCYRPHRPNPSAKQAACKHEKTVSVTVAGKSDMRECTACHAQFSGRELAAEQAPVDGGFDAWR